MKNSKAESRDNETRMPSLCTFYEDPTILFRDLIFSVCSSLLSVYLSRPNFSFTQPFLCTTKTLKSIKSDVTRHRYGDEAHLDTTVKFLGLVMPQSDYPQLEYISQVRPISY